MIILGNPEFATGMKLAGMTGSYVVRRREDVLDLVNQLDKSEFIIANVSVIKLFPEFEEFKNVVSIPDDVNNFADTGDLKDIIRSAVGIDLDI